MDKNKNNSSFWITLNQTIPTLAIVVGGMWTAYLYFSHEREKNKVLLDLSYNQKKISELQMEQAKTDSANLKIREDLLSKEVVLKDFDIQSLDIKQKLSLNEIKLQELNQTSIGLKAKLDISNETINQLAITNNLARSLDVEFSVESKKSTDLKFRALTNEELADEIEVEPQTNIFNKKNTSKKICILQEHFIEINIKAKNKGKQEITIGKNKIVFYRGTNVKNDSSMYKIYNINTPFDSPLANAIIWEKIKTIEHASPFLDENGTSNKIGIGETKSITHEFLINLKPEDILGVEINLENNIANKNYVSKSFQIVDIRNVSPLEFNPSYRIQNNMPILRQW